MHSCAKPMLPMTAVRMLLKSCAIPPASVPRPSMRCALVPIAHGLVERSEQDSISRMIQKSRLSRDTLFGILALGDVVNRSDQTGAPSVLVEKRRDRYVAIFCPGEVNRDLVPFLSTALKDCALIFVEHQGKRGLRNHFIDETSDHLFLSEPGRAKKRLIDR